LPSLEKHLNIISFDVPYPPNYGGVIDVFYKLVWLKKTGVKVYLHCFTYGRKPSPELSALCEKVYYYERKTGLMSNFSYLPYTVKSRQSEELEKNLLSNNYPILFEVLHTCYLMGDERFRDREKIYRHSNIEHEYYRHLAESEKNFLKKIYLRTEASKLEKFESVVKNASCIMAVNELDADYFKKKYLGVKTLYVPSFHANDEVSSAEGKGDYILYHGNLSVSENHEAAQWLIENVFSKTGHPVIIAGLNPPGFLKEMIAKTKHIGLRENPSESEMQTLVNEAQINCLYTSQPTGLKLKLLNVLFSGRFVVCNPQMVSGTGFQSNNGLLIADDLVAAINQCFYQNFSVQLIDERKTMLQKFSNSKNIKILSDAIFSS
jgi:hypothetical protein